MDSSKISLKEGFDFLFEDDEISPKKDSKPAKKFKIDYKKDDIKPNSLEEKIAFILTVDVVSSVISGFDEPLLAKIHADPKGAGSKFNWVQGRTISFDKLNKRFTSVKNFSEDMGFNDDNVANATSLAQSLRLKYQICLADLMTAGASRMMLTEAKQNVLKISIKKYVLMNTRLKNSLISSGKTNLNFAQIFNAILKAVNSGQLLKSSASDDKKIKDNENFVDLNENQKIAFAIKEFLKGLSPSMRKSFGKKRTANLINLLADEDNVSTDPNKEVKTFIDSLPGSVSTKNKVALKSLVEKLTSSPNQNQANIENMAANTAQIVNLDVIPGVNFSEKELENKQEDFVRLIEDPNLTTDTIQDELFSSIDDMLDKDSNAVDSQEIDSNIEEAKKIIKSLEEDFNNLKKECDNPNKDEQKVKALTRDAAELLMSIIICKSGLEFALASYKSNNRISDDQAQRFEKVVSEIKRLAGRFRPLFESLQKSESVDPETVTSDFTTVAFDPNTVSRIDFSKIAPELNQDEVVTKAKEEFNDIKTQIGGPAPQTDSKSKESDDSDTAVEDKKYNQITIKTPLPECKDYNDFVQHYLILSALAAHLSPESELEIKAGSAKKMQSSQFINLLKSVKNNKSNTDRQLDDQMKGIFEQSISNLEKFANESVNGLIFEREGGAQKFWVKMKASDVAQRIDIYKLSMEHLDDALVQAKDFVKACSFELTDSKGQAFANNTDDAINMFMRANTFQKEVVNNNQEELIFKVEGRDIFKIDDQIAIVAMNPATENDQVDVRPLSELVNVNSDSLPKLLQIAFSMSSKQSYTVGKFVSMRNQAKTKVMAGMLQTDAGMNAQEAEKSADQITKLLVSPDDSEPEIKDNISSVNDLLNDKVIIDLAKKLYRDDSLINYIAAIRDVDFAKVKVGTDIDLMNKFKADCTMSLNANIDSLKPMIRDIFKDEMKIVFDSLWFGRKKFDESAFQAAYGKLIISAFDKLIDKKKGRVTEGILSNLKRMTASGMANVLKMLPIAAPILGAASLVVASTTVPVLPVFLGGLGAWNTYSSWKSVHEFEKAKANYQKNPLQYIEDTIFKDASAKKVIQTLVNSAAADVVASRINPTYNKRQMVAKTGLMGGLSEYSDTLDAQVKEFKNLSKEDQGKAKRLNDHVLKQLEKTKYYNHVITESMINLIFNEMLFGKNRIGDEARNELLNSKLEGDRAKEVGDKLRSAIKNSSIKNNFVDFVEKEVRKASKIFSGKNKRFSIADDEELERRKVKDGKGLAALQDNEVFGMHAQLLISPEQIQEEFIDELLKNIIGKTKAEYKKSPDLKDRVKFEEGIIGGSLTKLLFEENDENNISSEQENLEKKRGEANKQKNTTLSLAALGAGTWKHSLYYTHYVDKLGGGGLAIFKDIVTNIPGTPTRIIDKFIPNPTAAADWNELGMDMGHNLIEYIDPITNQKQMMYFYYYSSSKFAGTAKALSAQIIDPLTGKAKMIQHNMSDWFSENSKWCEEAGLQLDADGETVSVIKGVAGAKELAANSQEMEFTSKAIMTNLEASYKAEVTEVQEIVSNFNIKGELQSLAEAGDIDMGEVIETIYTKLAIQKGMAAEGVASHFNPDDSLIGFFKHACVLLSKAADTGDTTAQKFKSFSEVNALIEKFTKGVQSIKDGYDLDMDLARVDGLTPDIIKELGNARAEGIEELFNKYLSEINIKWSEVVNKEVILKAFGSKAQLGHNPMLDFEVVEGQDGTIVRDTNVEGFTDPDIPVAELKSGWALALDSVAGALGKAGIISKIIGKFWKRGIKGGDFAKQFTDMFNLEDQTYSDMMRAFMGGEIKGTAKGTDANGNADSSNAFQPGQDINNTPADNNTGLSVANLSQEVIEESEASANESFVYKNNITDFLFENKLVTKSRKSSKISNNNVSYSEEINEHNELKDLFKKLF